MSAATHLSLAYRIATDPIITDRQARVMLALTFGLDGKAIAPEVTAGVAGAEEPSVSRLLGELVAHGWLTKVGLRTVGKQPDGRRIRRGVYVLSHDAMHGVVHGRTYVTYIAQRGPWVKIGKTSKPVEARLAQLSRVNDVTTMPTGMDVASPLRLLGVLDHDVEDALHSEFAHCRVAGEWFVPDEDMQAWLDTSFGGAR